MLGETIDLPNGAIYDPAKTLFNQTPEVLEYLTPLISRAPDRVERERNGKYSRPILSAWRLSPALEFQELPEYAHEVTERANMAVIGLTHRIIKNEI